MFEDEGNEGAEIRPIERESLDDLEDDGKGIREEEGIAELKRQLAAAKNERDEAMEKLEKMRRAFQDVAAI